jgi:hypothetical protein
MLAKNAICSGVRSVVSSSICVQGRSSTSSATINPPTAAPGTLALPEPARTIA